MGSDLSGEWSETGWRAAMIALLYYQVHHTYVQLEPGPAGELGESVEHVPKSSAPQELVFLCTNSH